jgi:hypothetical protein
MEEYNIEKASVGDFIGIRGTVKIENGKHIAIGRNHWVAQGLEAIGSFLVWNGYVLNSANGGGTTPYYGALYSWNIYLGSDTSTATTVSMTSLVSPIGTAPGTGPNTKSYSGVYYSTSTTPVVLTWIAAWNAGTVSGTLGETGLYLYIDTNTLTNGATASNPGLASRLSAADGSFAAFTINTAAALTVTWTVSLVYA